ncbi:ATP-dependent helicase HrpA [Isoalcanivorax pacificus W11-5]|uniref:ATP-dependent helicase HrpA n=1 Tax=Isoalcanivorax pacificus W11-5 TaxID=391936 RepID=A0A0B4XNY2_9GAMM|nr:ATP-dependent RNA helicase HrpA [Isoalcanivorax pacificus]AJD47982.1 ATP-dependent helicase HrpA [Isoalcanivorax pacificus W11-5]
MTTPISEQSPAAQLQALSRQLEHAMQADQPRLRRRLQGLRKRFDARALAQVQQALSASVARRAAREALTPRIDWPDLPVVQCLDELGEAIRHHQVVVVAGETGSGKTTQLPKLCLALGRGRAGMIGHTQPRRLAARAVANRLAEEIDTRVGEMVGFKVRFQDQVSDSTLVKLMTDGMLLAEIQQDRYLDQYDTLIIDEAHERSLNIDFLLGYLQRLLPRRPDLKIIITSATIDHERFAAHFGGAPVMEVSGRTYPVEVRYRDNAEEGERDLRREVEEVLREIEREERGQVPPARDVLVFLSGERDIRELHHHLRRCDFRDTEFLPLYARLTQQEQHRVFALHRGRRVVLSTNVAETSLTVPGIRYVIDAGTARISRYSVHSKVQRLPVEPVSQASAEQRKGRSGRVMPGICYRLYSEADFLSRPAFTDPEIRRTNLAAVILQMADLGLGELEDFPFIDAPDGRLVRDGYRLLEELGAIDGRTLSAVGRQLARLPLDPRLGRMVLRAADTGALREVLIIVAALSVQDPRERPHDQQQQADQAHQPFTDKQSDFVFFLTLWQWAETQREALTRNQYEKLLKKTFLSPTRMREWRDTHHQLLLLCREMKLPFAQTDASSEAVHRALLAGLLGQVIKRTEEGEWLSTRNRKPVIWPGSALSKSKASWLMAAELIDTSRLFARCVAQIQPEWIEQEGAHLVKRQYVEPYWSKKHGAVWAREQVSLFGLLLVAGRRVSYGAQHPELARELMIREGLVAGELPREPDFVRANRALRAELEEFEHKLRRRDLLADEEQCFAFYDARLPAGLYSLRHLESWCRRASDAERQALRMTRADLLVRDPGLGQNAFPDHLDVGELRLPLSYSFDPSGSRDGVTLNVPVTVLNQLSLERLDWLVPGLLRDKLEALLRGLPKAQRRHFVPVPDYVAALLEVLTPGDTPLLPALTRELARMTGVRIELEAWQAVTLPPHLQFNLRVTDGEQVLAEGRDLAAMQTRFAGHAVAAMTPAQGDEVLTGTDWVFGTLPPVSELSRGGVVLRTWPALEDRTREVASILCASEEEAAWQHRWGVARLLMLRQGEQVRMLRKFAGQQPGFQKMAAEKSALARGVLDDALLSATALHFPALASVRDESGFRALLAAGRGDFVKAVEARLAGWGGLLAAYRDIAARLDKQFPLAWAHAHRDIKQQLAGLFFPGFLCQVPPAWLAEYPRYLKALAHRLERLGGQIGRDRAQVAELEALWAPYQARAGDTPVWRQPEPLLTYRFLLEEYRVSLFAQQLGTRMPVSAKRLRQQWEAC